MPPVADIERRVGQHEVGAQITVLVADKGIRRLLAQVEVDPANRQIHRRQAPGGGVGFLAVDRHIAQLAAVGFDKFFRLHEHATAAAAGVVNLAVVRVEHRHQGFDDAGRGVELPALFAFGAGELAEEVFVDLAEQVAGLAGVVTETDGGDQIHQLAELAVRQLGAGIALVEDVFQLGVFRLDGGQGLVDALADIHLLGGGANRLPACRFRHPEHVDLTVVVAVFQLGIERLRVVVAKVVVIVLVGQLAFQLDAAAGEAVGNVLEEDQPKHNVLVLGGIHIGAQLVGSSPEGFLHGLDAGGSLYLDHLGLAGCRLDDIAGGYFGHRRLETLTRLAQRLRRQAGTCGLGAQHGATTPATFDQYALTDQRIARFPELLLTQAGELALEPLIQGLIADAAAIFRYCRQQRLGQITHA
ncbi:hypothetical protein D9M70_456280 [compost metagenome]